MTAETNEDLTTSITAKGATIDIWTAKLDDALNHQKNFEDEAKKNFDIYRDQHNLTRTARGTSSERYNIFWSNTQTLRPLVFSNLPKPNITRRFLDDDDVARKASEMMERSLSYSLEETEATAIFNKVRDDFLIGGRGVARVTFDPEEVIEIEEDSIDESGQAITIIREEIDPDTKKVGMAYVPWRDLVLSPHNVWEDVTWIAFRHKFTRDQLVDRFGKKGEKVNLNASSLKDIDSQDPLNNNDIFKLAEIWEIWDKEDGRVLWLSIGHDGDLLADDEDTYGLKNFFPIAKPLGSNSDPESLLPIPLYRMYRSQAEELNSVDRRIKSLVEQVKFTGVYSSIGAQVDVESLMNGEDGEFNPMQGVTPGQNIKDAIFTKPIDMIMQVIAQLNDQKSRIILNIRDITGLSDIVRGTTVASETATAQRLKGDFAISRVQPLQKETEIFIRDTQRMQVELIVENFTIEELAKMTGLKIVDIENIAQVTQEKLDALLQQGIQQIQDPNTPEGQQQIQQLQEQAKAGFEKTMKKPQNDLKGYAATPTELAEIDRMLKSDKARSFSIDIETDSTVRIDQNQLKQDRLEYITAVSNFSSSFFPLVQAEIISPEAFNAFLGFISKPFKVGRNLEDHLLSVEEKEPEGPSLEEQLAQAENQRKDQELQLKAQEVDIKQQEVDVKKAEAKIGIEQFNDKLEFEDVNKEADRRAKTTDQLIQDRTQRVTSQIRESNLV